MYQYKTHGTCSQQILIDVDGDTIANVEFIGGCTGNTQGARPAGGPQNDEIISSSIQCRGRTSRPDCWPARWSRFRLSEGVT